MPSSRIGWMSWALLIYLLSWCCWQDPARAQAQEPAADAPAAAPAAPAPAPAPATDRPPVKKMDPLIHFLFFEVVGWVLIITYLVFVALLVYVILDLRLSNLMPVDFIEALEAAVNGKKFKEAFELSKAEPSMLGKVMTAGFARLQSGLGEARDAANAMLESAKDRKMGLLSYLAVIGTLGPLIGLVGTVSGMIQTFAKLADAVAPRPAELAEGISSALYATLIGIFLSVLAIPTYAFFKTKLSRLILDAHLLSDDLLTQTYFNSRGTGSAGATAKTAAAPGPAASAAAPAAPPKA